MRDMKIVLMRSVDNLGQAGEVVTAKKGYYRNYLGPRGMALVASPANLKVAEAKKHKLNALVAAETTDAQGTKAKLDGGSIVFKMRANEKGQLFGSVTTREIVDTIKATFGVEVERRKIDADGMKTLGKHTVRVRIYPGITATLSASIERIKTAGEEEEEATAAAEATKA